MVPLNVHLGEWVYRDNDLSSDEFLRLLAQSPALPTTSEPSEGLFEEVYSCLGQQAEAIVSIHVSCRLSGTHNSDLAARETTRQRCSTGVIDSQTGGKGLGYVPMAAA